MWRALLYSWAITLTACSGPPHRPERSEGGSPAERPDPVVELASGSSHVCARYRSGQIVCWGCGETGQLGDGTRQTRDRPVRVRAISRASSIAASGNTTCATSIDGRVWCWGDSEVTQRGSGYPGGLSATPMEVSGLPQIRSVSLNTFMGCGLTESGTVLCWGNDRLRRVHTGDLSAGPASVWGIDDAEAIGGGDGQMCARRRQGVLLCWGMPPRWHGPGYDERPLLVSGLDHVRMWSIAYDHACAVDSGLRPWCWGANESGQLGTGTIGFVPSSAPTPVVGLQSVVAIEAGPRRTCAIRTDGTLWCWGVISPYDAAIEDMVVRPRRAPGLAQVTQLVMTDQGSICVIERSGSVRCWNGDPPGHEVIGPQAVPVRLCPSRVHTEQLPPARLGEHRR